MASWLTDFRSTYLDGVLSLLWHHWNNLGVLGQQKNDTNVLLDPEALIFATIQFGRYDPRLFDAALDWCLSNNNWLSSTRLKRFRKLLDPEERAILSAVAATLVETGKSAKWDSLSKNVPPTGTESSIRLFLLRDERPLPHVGATDPIFLRFGIKRPVRESRRLSMLGSLGDPGILRLRLRAFMGVTSRVEIILYLLTHERAHPRLLARQVHYAQPPIAMAMADMASSGLIFAHRIGREVEYHLDKARWRQFLDVPDTPIWVNWPPVFLALTKVWKFVRTLERRTPPISVLGSELLRCAEEIKPILYDGEIRVPFITSESREPETYPEVFKSDLLALIHHLEFSASSPASRKD